MALNVRVVHLDSCSATPKTISLIKETARQMGIEIRLESVVVRNDEEARRFRHIGSPTVQVNGLDIEPDARGIEQFGLS